jgi:hypothetical protein
MQSLIIQIHQLHDCLKIICTIESSVLSANLLALFKKKNYAGNANMLDVVCRKLIELHTSIDIHRGRSRGVDQVIDDAKNYIELLILSTAKLIEINQRLSEKAKGKSYSMGEYKNDLAAFRVLQERYCVIGDRMNANYSLYSYEIALIR